MHASSESVELVAIDLEELQSARRDERLRALVSAAVAEGAAVESEGRRHW